jgi:hypothetical protein
MDVAATGKLPQAARIDWDGRIALGLPSYNFSYTFFKIKQNLCSYFVAKPGRSVPGLCVQWI